MKQNLSQLAVFGGRPAFDLPLHVGRPNVGDRARLLTRLGDIIDRRWLTNDGPAVQEFEHRIADATGARHCVATCNATVALEIAVRAAGLKGEVLVPSFTFVATAHALQWQDITPVFCDIDPQTHAVDPAAIEALITPSTTGILGVHLWGEPCAVDALAAVARRHNLMLLFDAAHAFGCTDGGRPLAAFGLASVLSFHATKIVNAAEGGAIITDDDGLARRARLMKSFGFAGADNVVCLGTNAKMSEVSAAFGLSGLESLDTFMEANKSNYLRYRANLDGVPGVSLFPVDDRRDRRNFHYVVIEVDERETGLGRDDLMRVLTAERVLARRYFWPGCHRMEPYRSLFPDVGRRLPHTERVAGRVLVLPTGTAASSADVDGVCDLIRLAVSGATELSDRLRTLAPHA